jgi:general stress protein YciG
MKAQGFAAMDEERRKECARKGGKACQKKGTGHRYRSSAEARRAQKLSVESRLKKKSEEEARA